jgi:eukaryotic-like serine/threonine-protein kinase
LLDEALSLSEDKREVLLQSLAESKPDLADLLRMLLEEHRALTQERFLEFSPGAPGGGTFLQGQRVGPYTLISPIGEGGMGKVWLAERSDGRFRRRVAVKFLQFSVATRMGAERFKREGRILGALVHPHIAELIDAGVMPDGQPYMVLEYVEGEPIDEYCDARGLDVNARIHLFLDVLSALGHAHANLVVHRDIKPSNVLVSAAGQVKLLDFGIAKLLAPDGDSHAASLVTMEGGAALTPYFAAPEQLTSGAITTATDLYAAGTVLYLLLTGQHPAGLLSRSTSTADLIKGIVEKEPLRPSDAISAAKLGTEAMHGTGGAGKRAWTPAQLRRQLRGDLDTIVLKTLKKAPEERYGSVAALMEDLRRYLDHEPISARPDTVTYRAAKFVRRNRLAVALASIAVIALTSGLVGTLIQARTARRERDSALRERDRADRIAQFITDMFRVSDPNEARGNTITAREILDRASAQIDVSLANDPELQTQMISVMGKTYSHLGLYSAAQPLLERAIDAGRRANGPGNPDVLRCQDELGLLLIQEGRLADATKMLQETLATAQRALGPENPVTLETMSDVAYTLVLAGHNAEASDLARHAFEEQLRVQGEGAVGTLWSMNNLALILGRDGRLDDSEELYRKELDIERRVHGSDSVGALNAMSNLGATLIVMRRFSEGQDILRQTLAIQRRMYGSQAPETGRTLYNLACAEALQGHRNEAFSLLHEAIPAIYVRTLLGIEKDSDLDSLHGDPRWKAVIAIAKQRTGAQKHN